VIDDAKDATNAAIEAAKQAILKAIDEAKDNTGAKLEEGKKASEDALDQAHDATKLLDKAAEAAREVLDKAKQATSEVFDKAKDAAAALSKGSTKSTEASPAPGDAAPNEPPTKDKGPRDLREPQPDPQKWH
jgi:F0F1-type ATP synthase membrane subunit b/b'